MALQDDLLEQAYHLAKRERRAPRQASLRRAISSAYYALFHLLVSDGAAHVTRRTPAPLRALVQRGFAHDAMKSVCKSFASRSPQQSTAAAITLPLEAQVVSVAATFVELQEARHRADYDLTSRFDRASVLQLIQNVTQAFADWRTVRAKPNAKVFLAALLLQKQWSR